MTLKEMAAKAGVPYTTVRTRLCRGKTLEQALTPKLLCQPRGKLRTAFGKTQTLREWEKETGIRYSTLANRIKRGMTLEAAIERGDDHSKINAYRTTYKGESITIASLCRLTGKPYPLISYRVRVMGLTGDEAVERPVVHGGYRGRRELFANGCRYHADCDSCPFDDCRM